MQHKPITQHVEVWQRWMNIVWWNPDSVSAEKPLDRLKLQLHSFSPGMICKPTWRNDQMSAWWDEPSVYLDFKTTAFISNVLRNLCGHNKTFSFISVLHYREPQFTHQVIFEGNWLDCFSILGCLSTVGRMQMHDIPFQILFMKQFEGCPLLCLGQEQQNMKNINRHYYWSQMMLRKRKCSSFMDGFVLLWLQN